MTAKNIKISDNIFSPNTASLKGKTVRKYQEVKTNYIQFHRKTQKRKKQVVMAAGVVVFNVPIFIMIM